MKKKIEEKLKSLVEGESPLSPQEWMWIQQHHKHPNDRDMRNFDAHEKGKSYEGSQNLGMHGHKALARYHKNSMGGIRVPSDRPSFDSDRYPPEQIALDHALVAYHSRWNDLHQRAAAHHEQKADRMLVNRRKFIDSHGYWDGKDRENESEIPPPLNYQSLKGVL